METNTVNPTRRLERGDGPVGGVAAGLADYFDLDATVVRIGLVAGALVGFPVVPITYLAAWVIIPRAETSWAPRSSGPIYGQPLGPTPTPTPPPAPVAAAPAAAPASPFVAPPADFPADFPAPMADEVSETTGADGQADGPEQKEQES